MNDLNQNQQVGWAQGDNLQRTRALPTAEEQLSRRLMRIEEWLGECTPEAIAKKQAEAESIRGALALLLGTKP